MAQPLFTEAELDQLRERFDQVEAKYAPRRGSGIPWDEYWSQRKAVERAHLIEKVRRVQERADEFINALLIVVGSKGRLFMTLDDAFAKSDSPEVMDAIKECDTPQSRRDLYTILRALTEIPKTWARSAFVRFLRGTGKQKGAQYHGAGMFGTAYGWQEKGVTAICEVLADSNSAYAKILMSYADIQEELREADPDFEVVDYKSTFAATRVERDVEFINQLCDILEKRGLAEVARAKEQQPKKPHQPKIFKSGDIIRKGTIRDLQLPAHVRVNILKRSEGSSEWVKAQLDWVVIKLGDYGDFLCYRVDRDGKKAYPANDWSRESKNYLVGAVYIGPWEGELLKKELRYKFNYRPCD